MRPAHLRSARRVVLALALILVAIATSCAPAFRSGGYDYLVIENQSPDVIRVWFDGGFEEVVLGEVRPLGRGKLKVWRNDVADDLSNVYIRVAPVTDPVREGEPPRRPAVSSELFRMADAPAMVWTYTGQRLIGERR